MLRKKQWCKKKTGAWNNIILENLKVSIFTGKYENQGHDAVELRAITL